MLKCMSYLYTLDINPLSDKSFANIFPHSVCGLFILLILIVSFTLQKFSFMCICAESCQSRPTLQIFNAMDCSLPASSVHGILQSKIVEWVAMSSSRDLPDPGIKHEPLKSLHWQVSSVPLAPPGKPSLM